MILFNPAAVGFFCLFSMGVIILITWHFKLIRAVIILEEGVIILIRRGVIILIRGFIHRKEVIKLIRGVINLIRGYPGYQIDKGRLSF